MQKIIGVTELQRNFRSVFDEVARDHMPYVLTRGSRPEAAIIPYDEFTRFLLWKEQEVVFEFDRAMARLAERNASYGDDEIDADVDAAITEVRTGQAQQP
ncbi:MAG TPA: type II toxin-antitoxin system Phd/YefM family antitoxin [Anaerolineae bacterium]|nr:type II toxin-antitoxin system Phd/YefM family antitoxin [Anaerolineae bacterium]HNU04768.1 type II toxin-antitoxin system Phd/YefM family antitoxin [Anaerolineae bacterium]